MNACLRPLDPIDAEALASGAEPVEAADAAEHVRACASCAAAVADAAAFAEALDSAGSPPDPAPAAGMDLASGVLRLRPFSRRERLDFSLWSGPSLMAVALFLLGVLLLALPGITARDQAGLIAAALAPAAALLRAASRSLAELLAVAPSGLDALSFALRGQSAFGLASLLLLAPAAWGLKRALARERR
ncbi:MAG TPA: hypothetical protein VKH43_13930 [Thermoanaerobaculia bacterium]|nr:hypothetical protein [Thermoanaerobaculia bacterium]